MTTNKKNVYFILENLRIVINSKNVTWLTANICETDIIFNSDTISYNLLSCFGAAIDRSKLLLKFLDGDKNKLQLKFDCGQCDKGHEFELINLCGDTLEKLRLLEVKNAPLNKDVDYKSLYQKSIEDYNVLKQKYIELLDKYKKLNC